MTATFAGAVAARIVAANAAHAAEVAARPQPQPDEAPTVDALAEARARRLATEADADLAARRAASLAQVTDRLARYADTA